MSGTPAYSFSRATSPQDGELASDAFAHTSASLEGESSVGRVTSWLKSTENPPSDNGDEKNFPDNCGPNADHNSDSESISDTLPSEASPAESGSGFGNTMNRFHLSHSVNTVTSLEDGLHREHLPTKTFYTTSSDFPGDADSPWRTYKIPEEFNEKGRVTAWKEVTLQKVKPDISEAKQGQGSGSALLDTEEQYLIMPIDSLDPGAFVPPEVERFRRATRKTVRYNVTSDPYTRTGLSDDEESITNDEESITNDEVSITNDEVSITNDEVSITNGNLNGDENGDDHHRSSSPEEPEEIASSNSDSSDTEEEPEEIVSSNGDTTDSEEEQEQFAPSTDDDTGAAETPPVPFGGLSDIELRGIRECFPQCFPSQGDEKINAAPIPRCTDETGSVISSMSSDSGPFLIAPGEGELQVEDMQAHNVRHRVTVTTTDGGTVRFDLPQVIFISLPGMPTREVVCSINNLSQICWDIIKDHGIASVNFIKGEADDNSTFIDNFDHVWIQHIARPAMMQNFPDIAYYEGIQAECDQSDLALDHNVLPFYYVTFDRLVTHYLLNKPLAPPNGTLEELTANLGIISVDERNLTVPQFIKRLFIANEGMKAQYRRFRAVNGPHVPFPGVIEDIHETAAMADDWPVQERLLVPRDFNHDHEQFDLQQFNWERDTGLTADEVRDYRDMHYQEYRNTPDDVTHGYPTLHETVNIAQFVPKAMYTKHKASTAHMQLRNLMACKGYNAVVYASDRGSDKSKVFHYIPFYGQRKCIMDLSEASNDTVYAEPVRISTLALSTGDYTGDNHRGICMVGGFDGEYALKNMLNDAEDPPVIVGHATRATSGIINHIDIDYFAHDAYKAVLACNDNKVRILDVDTNTFLSDPGSNTNTAVKSGQLSGHQYPYPVNCTSMCPDGKMRVIVGDTKDVVVVDAESGATQRVLQGHDDYAFAVAWSPDGRYIASAAQDRLVNIWDARTWRVLTSFAADSAGYRSMRWSPPGGGSKCLLLAEPADRICIVNATDFEQCQTHEFYGEIVGVDFHGDGTGIWVANADEKFGGFMEYERRGYSLNYGWGFSHQDAIERAGDEYREQGPNEWLWTEQFKGDSRVVDPGRTGALGHWASMGLY